MISYGRLLLFYCSDVTCSLYGTVQSTWPRSNRTRVILLRFEL